MLYSFIHVYRTNLLLVTLDRTNTTHTTPIQTDLNHIDLI